MARDQTPAIVREYQPTDVAMTILGTPYDGVNHRRGFGDSGYRVEVVEHDCPECDFDRMIRRVDVTPVAQDEARYWCLYPNCVHFVGDTLSHACHGSYPQRDTDTPSVVEEYGHA